MMLGIQHLAVVAECISNLPVDEQLILDPERSCQQEGLEASGSDAEIGFQYTIKLQQGLVVESHIPQILRGDAGVLETVGHRLNREGGITLLSSEPLLRGGSDDLTVSEETGSAIVIKCRDAQDVLRQVERLQLVVCQWSRPSGSSICAVRQIPADLGILKPR